MLWKLSMVNERMEHHESTIWNMNEYGMSSWPWVRYMDYMYMPTCMYASLWSIVLPQIHANRTKCSSYASMIKYEYMPTWLRMNLSGYA